MADSAGTFKERRLESGVEAALPKVPWRAALE